MRMVSIIIPVYNVKEYLRECVESVRRQTLSEIEIVLVDDGSTDGSAELCDEYAKLDSRIQVIHQANGGNTRARNAGIAVSQGGYLGFVDSDDWIEPNMYEELLKYCEEAGADLAASVKYINHGRGEYKEALGVPEGVYEKGSSGDLLVRNLIYSEDYVSKGISPSLCDKLFKKDLLCEYQFSIDERIGYAEDATCVYTCLLHAERVVMVDRAYYHYRMREGSITHAEDTEYFIKITWFYQQLKKEFEKHCSHQNLMEQLDRYMLEHILRGINRQFGFNYGVVMPFYLPPYETLKTQSVRRLALYGAGDVGQDYVLSFRLSGSVEIVVWVDREYEKYQDKGLPVTDVSSLNMSDYDAVLIAIDNVEAADQIAEELLRRGIRREKIIYEKPKRIIQDLQRG